MNLNLPLFNFTQWKGQCALCPFTTKTSKHSMCHVSLVIKYIYHERNNPRLPDSVGVCNCSMFCCTLLYVPTSFAIILMGKMGKREQVVLLSLSSWCLVIVVWLFLAVPWVCVQFVIVVFPDHTHLLFLMSRLLCLCLVVTVKSFPFTLDNHSLH